MQIEQIRSKAYVKQQVHENAQDELIMAPRMRNHSATFLKWPHGGKCENRLKPKIYRKKKTILKLKKLPGQKNVE